jgi:type IV pilus assembly protein PilX
MQIRQKQTGSALIVSLMILLVMTIIGISTISGTNLEERMSQNFQFSTIAFQAAESAINKVIDAGNPGGAGASKNPFYDAANDPLVASINTGIGNTSTVVTHNMDPDGHLANTTLNTSSTVVYDGGKICPGMSMGDMTCHYFEIQTNATIAASSTSTNHVQGIYRPAPNAGS